jgi:predicted DNA binding CopG/RHH family protein
MLSVRRLVWDPWNVDHIARHQVTPEQVEEVCHGPNWTSSTYAGRLRVIGPDKSSTMLAVILAPREPGVYCDGSASQPQGAPALSRAARRAATMTTERRPARRRVQAIPEFASIEEEAEFWDKHDTTDFEDQFKPIKVRFAKNLTEGITIRFDPETLTKLREQAKKRGIGPTTLARMWILEHLQRV